MNKVTDVIKHLIILNVILYLAPQFLDFDIQHLFALHFPESDEFGFWQFLTHMFMHSQHSFMHILFNMYGLWAFGTPLEQMWGKSKFIFFYFSTGLGAGLIYTAVNYYQFNSVYEQLTNAGVSIADIQNLLKTGSYNNLILESISEQRLGEFYSIFNSQVVGASGAIYGILVAFGLAFPNAKLGLMFIPIPISAKYFIPLIIASDIFFGITKYSIGNIAHFAHVGGAIIGFIIAWYWKKHQFKQYN